MFHSNTGSSPVVRSRKGHNSRLAGGSRGDFIFLSFPVSRGCPYSLALRLFLHLFLNLFLVGGKLLYNVVLVSAIQQGESVISIHYVPSRLSLLHHPPYPTPLGLHRALGWAPCVIQQPPISYLFTIWQCVCFSTTLPIHPNFSFPCYVLKPVLYANISIPVLHIDSSVSLF